MKKNEQRLCSSALKFVGLRNLVLCLFLFQFLNSYVCATSWRDEVKDSEYLDMESISTAEEKPLKTFSDFFSPSVFRIDSLLTLSEVCILFFISLDWAKHPLLGKTLLCTAIEALILYATNLHERLTLIFKEKQNARWALQKELISQSLLALAVSGVISLSACFVWACRGLRTNGMGVQFPKVSEQLDSTMLLKGLVVVAYCVLFPLLYSLYVDKAIQRVHLKKFSITEKAKFKKNRRIFYGLSIRVLEFLHNNIVTLRALALLYIVLEKICGPEIRRGFFLLSLLSISSRRSIMAGNVQVRNFQIDALKMVLFSLVFGIPTSRTALYEHVWATGWSIVFDTVVKSLLDTKDFKTIPYCYSSQKKIKNFFRAFAVMPILMHLHRSSSFISSWKTLGFAFFYFIVLESSRINYLCSQFLFFGPSIDPLRWQIPETFTQYTKHIFAMLFASCLAIWVTGGNFRKILRPVAFTLFIGFVMGFFNKNLPLIIQNGLVPFAVWGALFTCTENVYAHISFWLFFILSHIKKAPTFLSLINNYCILPSWVICKKLLHPYTVAPIVLLVVLSRLAGALVGRKTDLRSNEEILSLGIYSIIFMLTYVHLLDPPSEESSQESVFIWTMTVFFLKQYWWKKAGFLFKGESAGNFFVVASSIYVLLTFIEVYLPSLLARVGLKENRIKKVYHLCTQLIPLGIFLQEIVLLYLGERGHTEGTYIRRILLSVFAMSLIAQQYCSLNAQWSLASIFILACYKAPHMQTPLEIAGFFLGIYELFLLILIFDHISKKPLED